MKPLNFMRAFAFALFLDATLAVPSVATALNIPTRGLTATNSGKDLVLSFPTTSPFLYSLQSCPDLLQPWSNVQSGMLGDGTGRVLTISNALPAGEGFYRLLIQSPTSLMLPQAMAFPILHYSCGGIKEKSYVTGFDQTSGHPTGEVYLSTTCSAGGRGGHSVTITAWAAVTWDLTGNVVSSSALSNAPPINPSFIATDAYGDYIYNVGGVAHLVIPPAGPPTDVTVVQSGDQFQVSWAPSGITPAAVASSVITATPVSSAVSILTTTVTGSATTGVVPALQPATTYQVTVVNTTVSGPSPASTAVRVTTVPATIPPSAPSGVTAKWLNPDPAGTNDTLVATWQAANPGNSPVDQYQVTILGSDSAGTAVQLVSGTTLTASFNIDPTPNWSVTVQAHNAADWGPSSSAFVLGGL